MKFRLILVAALALMVSAVPNYNQEIQLTLKFYEQKVVRLHGCNGLRRAWRHRLELEAKTLVASAQRSALPVWCLASRLRVYALLASRPKHKAFAKRTLYSHHQFSLSLTSSLS